MDEILFQYRSVNLRTGLYPDLFFFQISGKLPQGGEFPFYCPKLLILEMLVDCQLNYFPDLLLQNPCKI